MQKSSKMKLINAQYSIVIVNPAITPLGAESFNSWDKLGKITEKILIPPLFRIETGANVTIQITEGKAEFIYKSKDFTDEFYNLQNFACIFLESILNFETRALGINLNGTWSSIDFDFNSWRKRIFNFSIKHKKIFEQRNILKTAFNIQLQEEGFIRNLNISEFEKDDIKGLRVNVNNHFDIKQNSAKFKTYQQIIKKTGEIIKTTITEIEKNWIVI